MPQSIIEYEMKNIEFWVERSTLTSSVIYAKFLSHDKIICFDELSDNQINILYLGLIDYAGLLKECVLPTDTRRQVLKKFIIRHWGALDTVADIDEKGHFNFEQGDLAGIVADLVYSISFWIMELLKVKMNKRQELIDIDKQIHDLHNDIDLVKSVKLKTA